MSESGDEKQQQGRRRGGNSDEKELASQLVQIQSKRFYIDVKENPRGRFIKLAEVGVGGRKSRILMTMGAAAEFKNRLGEFSELHSQMGPNHGSPAAGAAGNNDANNKRGGSGGDNNNDGLIKSETIIKDHKRYYLDLKENQRGRFLRVSMVLSRGPRAYLAIPAQGLIEFKDHLSDMLERYGTDLKEGGGNESGGASGGASQGGPNSELPESKSFRAENKTFYFDCGSNQRGVFLKVSEVRLNRFRTAITIPEKFLKQFRDQINEFVDNAAFNNSADKTQDSGEGKPAAKA